MRRVIHLLGYFHATWHIVIDGFEEDLLRVASDAVLDRAARLRENGESWLKLTRTDQSRKAGLAFFKGARSGRPLQHDDEK